MIIGTGIDIVEFEKIKTAITRSNQRFITRVYTEFEQNICNARNNPIGCYCSRFAAKEALAKAYKIGILKAGVKNIEIRNRPDGSPYYVLHNTLKTKVFKENHRLHLSLSDSEHWAIAMATVEEMSR